MENNHEELDVSNKTFKLEAAFGGIQAEEITPELAGLIEKLNAGEYHKACSGEIVRKCIDGRSASEADGSIEGPNSAGGTIGLLVADDLTTRRYASADGDMSSAMTRLVEDFQSRGLDVGVHADDHASGDGSGCGANDKLPVIYSAVLTQSADVRQLAESILGEIDDATHDMIVNSAQERLSFSSGKDMRDSVVSVAGESASETLQGDHKEVVAIINLKPSTTLDRQALASDTDGNTQAFNVDAWAFEASVRAISSEDATDEEIRAKVVALTYYNLATALVLCGPNMVVGVRN